MFQICLTSEKSAAFESWQQELLFFSGSFLCACGKQSKSIFSIGLEMLFFGMRELQVLTGLLLGRLVVKRKGPELFSIPVATLPNHHVPFLWFGLGLASKDMDSKQASTALPP